MGLQLFGVALAFRVVPFECYILISSVTNAQSGSQHGNKTQILYSVHICMYACARVADHMGCYSSRDDL
jgi:hypothetical protein